MDKVEFLMSDLQKLSLIIQNCGINNYKILESIRMLTEYLVKKEYKKALKHLDGITPLLKSNQSFLTEGSLILIAYRNKSKGDNNE